MSDETLFQRFQSGDQDAFDHIFRRYRMRLILWLRRTGCNSDLADEITQRTFIKLRRVKDLYDPSRPFEAWIRTIARNIRKDLQKAAFRRRKHEVNFTDIPSRGFRHAIYGDQSSYLADKHGTPLDHLEVSHDSKVAMFRFNRLTPDIKAAVQAMVLDGESSRHAAEHLDISHRHVQNRMHAGLKQLRREMAA
jgi:RNA polymerase sigma factor (sigma-70 family)